MYQADTFRQTDKTTEANFNIIAQQATKLLLSLAQDQNLHAPGNRTWVFSCPVFARESYHAN